MTEQPYVFIEDDICAGSNVTILSGAHISRGCVIAAGSVVNKYLPPYSIVGGFLQKFSNSASPQSKSSNMKRSSILKRNDSQEKNWKRYSLKQR